MYITRQLDLGPIQSENCTSGLKLFRIEITFGSMRNYPQKKVGFALLHHSNDENDAVDEDISLRPLSRKGPTSRRLVLN
jgi:hypothetical protein